MVPRLTVITDPTLSDAELVARIEAVLGAVSPGLVAIQLRCRERSARALLSLGESLKVCCERWKAPLVINDRLDVALALGVTRVHLGGASVDVTDARRLLGNGAYVSVAAHAPHEVVSAERAGADAVLLAPIFVTPGPGKGAPLGLEALALARRMAPKIALYALGGVDGSNAAACFAAGSTGIAAIRSVLRAADSGRAAKDLIEY
jgi:thiamine-phosphate pyrophosphorylase